MKQKSIKQLWNDTPAIAKIAIFGVGAFVAYRVGKNFYDKAQIRKKLKQYQQSQIQYNVVGPGGQQAAQTVNLSSVAGEIYDSFYSNDWFNWTEDEERAINAIKTVPKTFIPQLEQTYFQLYSKDLRADLLNFLSSSEWSQISYLFN